MASRSDEPPQASGRVGHAAEEQQGPLAHAAGELAEAGGEEGDHRRAGADRQPGLQDRPAPDVGQEEDRAEEHGREGRAEDEHRPVGPAVVLGRGTGRGPGPGAAAAALVLEEDAEQDEAAGQGADGPAVGPAPVVALHDAQRQRRPMRRRSGRPRWLPAGACPRRSTPAGRRRPSDDGDDAHGQVEEEDPAPAGGLDQGGAEGRADGAGRRARRPPDGHGVGHLLGGEGPQHQGQRGGDRAGPSPRPGRSGRRSSSSAVGATAQASEARVKAVEPRRNRRLWPSRSPSFPAGTSSDGEGDRVGVQHPRQLGRAGVGERPDDVGEGHEQDGRVEEGGQHGERGQGQRPPAVGRRQSVASCNALWHNELHHATHSDEDERRAAQELRGHGLLGGPLPGGGRRVVDAADRPGPAAGRDPLRRLPGPHRHLPQRAGRPPRQAGRRPGS